MNIDIEKKWQLQIERGEMAFETCNYVVAEENYLQALQEAEQFLSNPTQAYTQGVPAISLWIASCNKLARLFEEWRKPKQSSFYYQKTCDGLSHIALDTTLHSGIRMVAVQGLSKAFRRLCNFYESENEWEEHRRAMCKMEVFNTKMKKNLIKE
jgi:hypothetical protein